MVMTIEEEIVEVLFVDHAKPGDRVILEGAAPVAEDSEEKKRLKIDQFFAVPLSVRNHTVYAGEGVLACGGKRIITSIVENGEVG